MRNEWEKCDSLDRIESVLKYGRTRAKNVIASISTFGTCVRFSFLGLVQGKPEIFRDAEING